MSKTILVRPDNGQNVNVAVVINGSGDNFSANFYIGVTEAEISSNNAKKANRRWSGKTLKRAMRWADKQIKEYIANNVKRSSGRRN